MPTSRSPLASDPVVERVLGTPFDNLADLQFALAGVRPSQWHEIGRRALAAGLRAARTSAFHRDRVACTDAEIDDDPFAAVLRFPRLSKQVYWRHAQELRLEGYADDRAHTFHTSGTELGVPTEQPWDDWTFRRSFCESSALALLRADVHPGDRAIIGSPSFGALAQAYAWAGERLGLSIFADGSAFSDEEAFADVLAFAAGPGSKVLVAAPGAVITFIERLKAAGVTPASLGLKAVISGIGNHLTERHLRLITEELDPQVVAEQGGKNEILHALGGIRHDRGSRARVCAPGYLHYLPHVAHVTAVAAGEAGATNPTPIEDGQPGLLLMTRLSSGRPGIVAYVNDACDLGSVRRFDAGQGEVCPCGSALPAFRFLGRASGCLSNRLGDTLFTEEFDQALAAACRAVSVPVDVAARIRSQIVLARDADWSKPDTLFWIIGAPRDSWALNRDVLRALRGRCLELWPGYHNYASGRYAAHMRIGRTGIIDVRALPHAGRDKPQYQVNRLLEVAPGQSHDRAFAEHLRGFGVDIFDAGDAEQPPATDHPNTAPGEIP